MDQRDARKLTNAINDLVNQLRTGGGTTPSGSPNPSSSSTDSSSSGIDVSSFRQEQTREDEKRLQRAQKILEIETLSNEQQDEMLRKLQAKVDLTTEEEELRSALQEIQRDGNTLVERQLEIIEDANKEIAKQNEGLDKQRKKQEDLLKIDQQRKRLAEEQAEAAEDIARSIGSMVGLRERPGGVTGLLATMIAGGKEGRKASLGGLAKGFKSLINPVSLVAGGLGGLTRIMQAAVEAVIYFAFQFDKLGSEIAKTTGHGRENAQQTMELAKATQGASATISDMTPVIVELGNELRGVNGISYETAASFAGVAISAERMGVSIKDTGLFMKDAMLGGGLSADEAKQSFSNLNKAASMMGVNFSQLSSEFMSNRAVFAAYGQNMEKVFLRTSSVARQMGVELNSVLGMSDKFKTFEDSAGFVSEFNHMVGASLDPLEMMRLRAQDGPEAVAKALQDSLQMSGKSFDELSFAMREGIADSLGIPMNELRNMMEADVDMSLADEVANAEQPVDMLISKGNETLTVLERIGKMLMQVAEQFATAFGFDQFAGGGLSKLLTEMEKFIKNDLSGTIMNDFVPFVKVDLPSIVSTARGFFDGLMKSDLLRKALGLKSYDEEQLERAKTSAAREVALANQLDFVTRRQLQGKISKDQALKELDDLGFSYSSKDSAMSEARKFRSLIKSGGSQKQTTYRNLESQRLKELDNTSMFSWKNDAILSAIMGEETARSKAASIRASSTVVPTAAKSVSVPSSTFSRQVAPSNSSSTSGGGQPVQVNVRIDANDRVLKNAFTTTVEDVITGGA